VPASAPSPAPAPDRKERRNQEFARRKQDKARRRKEMRGLRETGEAPPAPPAVSNAKCQAASIEEEARDRQEGAASYLKAMERHLPWIYSQFARINDPRQAKKVKHRIALTLLFGLLTFLFQKESRRRANAELTTPALLEVLRTLFPDIASLPHHGTVNRVLAEIDVSELQDIHLDLVRRLLRMKAFRRYRNGGYYTVAFDGTQKASLHDLWAGECLEAKSGDAARYYCYVLEASIAVGNGIALPLMTEFCEYDLGKNDKQDCEYRAFERLAARLMREFPRLKIMAVVDGLYASAPVFQLLLDNGWTFMINLRENSLPLVWEEYKALEEAYRREGRKQVFEGRQRWGGRQQHFTWINNIEYSPDNGRRTFRLHVVVCHERWLEPGAAAGSPAEKPRTFSWISSNAIALKNVHFRCNLCARHRWCIEEQFLVEKHHGYHYEHLFSRDWNAMNGYHCLMRMAHFLNELAIACAHVAPRIAQRGRAGFFRWLMVTLCGRWLDLAALREELSKPYQLRTA